ncbi:MAG: RNA polymerase sigma factor [Flavobacteriaceae bacterium]|nr:RNA polymerase sigma factor [Flavobacteriaceae bacterium]
MSLDKLIQQCKQNDIDAQAEIYQLYASKLFALCLKYSKNYQEAQDNLQNSFLNIFNKIGQYSFKGSFEGWIKRLTINTVLQTYREKNILNLVTEVIPDVEEVEVDDEQIPLDYLLQLIQELPNKYRMVFNMYVLDDYSHREIAEMLNISEGTSKSNLHRARTILKEKLQNASVVIKKNEAY